MMVCSGIGIYDEFANMSGTRRTFLEEDYWGFGPRVYDTRVRVEGLYSLRTLAGIFVFYSYSVTTFLGVPCFGVARLLPLPRGHHFDKLPCIGSSSFFAGRALAVRLRDLGFRVSRLVGLRVSD